MMLPAHIVSAQWLFTCQRCECSMLNRPCPLQTYQHTYLADQQAKHARVGVGVRAVGCAGTELVLHNVRVLENTPRTVHQRPMGDAFIMLACPQNELGSTRSSRSQHLLAASTLQYVLLMDMQQPDDPLLLWQHGAWPAPKYNDGICSCTFPVLAVFGFGAELSSCVLTVMGHTICEFCLANLALEPPASWIDIGLSSIS